MAHKGRGIFLVYVDIDAKGSRTRGLRIIFRDLSRTGCVVCISRL